MKTHYSLKGTPNSPVLIFSNSLGTNLSMWNDVAKHLLPYYQVLQYDTRGHGNSPVTQNSYTIELLGQDVIHLMDELKIETAVFCGLSLGGLIGQWLAIHHPKRITKLILSNTAAKIGEAETWNSRIETVTTKDMQGITEGAMERWFTNAFRKERKDIIEDYTNLLAATSASGYAKCCEVLRETDLTKEVKKIRVKTLVITGDEDTVTNVEHAIYLSDQIKASELKILRARHLSAVELPRTFAETLIDFLVGTTAADRGMHVRRTVLGNQHVDAANAKINSLNKDFQNFITQYAWGEIWTRPGLSKHQRSFITLSMLIALNREDEFKMHVKAAIHNGVSVEELKELILHSGVYCGLPAANAAYHSAELVLKELNISF